MEQRRRPVIEGMRAGDLGLEPLEPVALEWERAQVGRSDAERMHRGAVVVDEAFDDGIGERARPATGLIRRFEHRDPEALVREGQRGRQPVRSGADDDRVRARPLTTARRAHSALPRTMIRPSSASTSTEPALPMRPSSSASASGSSTCVRIARLSGRAP